MALPTGHHMNLPMSQILYTSNNLISLQGKLGCHRTEGENDSLSLFQITGKQDTGCSPPDIRFLGLLESGSSFRLQKVDIKSNTKYSKDKGYITTFEANVTSDIVEGLLDVIVTAGELGDNTRSSFQSSVKCAKKPNESKCHICISRYYVDLYFD